MGPQEEYIETVVTCEGDFYDPEFHSHLQDFSNRLQNLLTEGHRQLIVKKVEPWNSVRVTFNIPKEAAVRLKQLAEEGDQTLRELGVLAVQIEGDRSISLTIAGKNNETTELVLQTAGPAASSSGASVFDLPNSEEMNIPGPSNVESTRRNIIQYLREQGGAGNLFDSILNHPAVLFENFRPPDTIGAAAQGPHHPLFGHFPFGLPSGPGLSPGSNQQSCNEQIPLPPGFPPGSFPSSSSVRCTQTFSSPTTSHNHSPLSPNYPTPPPSVSNPSSPGSRTANFHAAMAGSSTAAALNNLPRLLGNRDITSSSPLLVNLLQNDIGGLAHLNSLMPSKIPGMPFPMPDMGQPPVKRRRKPRKPKNDTVKAKSPAGQESVAGMSGSIPQTSGSTEMSQGQNNLVPTTVPAHTQSNTDITVDNSGQFSQEMNLGNTISQNSSLVPLGTTISTATTTATTSAPLNKSPVRMYHSPLGICQSPCQAVSPRIQSPRAHSPGRAQSPVRAQSPARSKVSGGNPAHMVNPVTGQLEPTTSNMDIQQRIRGPAIKEGSMYSDDIAQTQLQPPPNPLVALKMDMVASTEVAEMPMPSHKQSSPKVITTATHSSHNADAIVKSISERCLSVMRSGSVSTSSVTSATNTSNSTSMEQLVRSNITSGPGPAGIPRSRPCMSNNGMPSVSTVTAAKLASTFGASTHVTTVPTPFVTSITPTVMTANPIPVTTSYHAPTSLTETIRFPATETAHTSDIMSSSSVLPPSFKPHPRLSLGIGPHMVSSTIPNPMITGSNYSVDSVPFTTTTPTTTIVVSSTVSHTTGMAFPTGSTSVTSTSSSTIDTGVSSSTASSSIVSSKDSSFQHPDFPKALDSMLESETIHLQQISNIESDPLHLQSSPSENQQAPRDQISSGVSVASTMPTVVTSQWNSVSGAYTLSTSGAGVPLDKNIQHPDSPSHKDGVTYATELDISSSMENLQSNLDELGDNCHQKQATQVEYFSNNSTRSKSPSVESLIDNILPVDEISNTDKHIVNCLSPNTVLSNATPEHEQCGTDGSESSSLVAHSQGKDSGIADVGHHILGKINCVVRSDDTGSDIQELRCSNGASVSEASPLSEADTISSSHPSQSPSVRSASIGLTNHDSELSSHSFDDHACTMSLSNATVVNHVPNFTNAENDNDALKEELVDSQTAKAELHMCSSATVVDTKVITVGYALSKEPPAVDLLHGGLSDKSLPFLTKPSNVFAKEGSIVGLKEFALEDHFHASSNMQRTKNTVLTQSPINHGETGTKDCLNWSKTLKLSPKLLSKTDQSDESPQAVDQLPNGEVQCMVKSSPIINGDDQVLQGDTKFAECSGDVMEYKDVIVSSQGLSPVQTHNIGLPATTVVNVQPTLKTGLEAVPHNQMTKETDDSILDTKPILGDAIKADKGTSGNEKGTTLSPDVSQTIVELASVGQDSVEQDTVVSGGTSCSTTQVLDVSTPSSVTSTISTPVTAQAVMLSPISPCNTLTFIPAATVPVMADSSNPMTPPTKTTTPPLLVSLQDTTQTNTFGASMVTTIVTSAVSMGDVLTPSFSMMPNHMSSAPIPTPASKILCTAQVSAVVLPVTSSTPQASGLSPQAPASSTSVQHQVSAASVHMMTAVSHRPSLCGSQSLGDEEPAIGLHDNMDVSHIVTPKVIATTSDNDECVNTANHSMAAISTVVNPVHSLVNTIDTVASGQLHESPKNILSHVNQLHPVHSQLGQDLARPSNLYHDELVPSLANCILSTLGNHHVEEGPMQTQTTLLHNAKCDMQNKFQAKNTEIEVIDTSRTLSSGHNNCSTVTVTSNSHHPIICAQPSVVQNDHAHHPSKSIDATLEQTSLKDKHSPEQEKSDCKPSRGISIMKPLYDRESEIEEEFQAVTPPDSVDNCPVTKSMKTELNMDEESKVYPNQMSNLVTAKVKSQFTVAQILEEADKQRRNQQQLKQKGLLATNIDGVKPDIPVLNDSVAMIQHRNKTNLVGSSPVPPVKTSMSSLDMSKNTGTHFANFVQKSLQTPAVLFNSTPHPITSPGFPLNLTESVKKVMNAIPTGDTTPPPSPLFSKGPGPLPVLSPSRLRAKSTSPVLDGSSFTPSSHKQSSNVQAPQSCVSLGNTESVSVTTITKVISVNQSQLVTNVFTSTNDYQCTSSLKAAQTAGMSDSSINTDLANEANSTLQSVEFLPTSDGLEQNDLVEVPDDVAALTESSDQAPDDADDSFNSEHSYSAKPPGTLDNLTKELDSDPPICTEHNSVQHQGILVSPVKDITGIDSLVDVPAKIDIDAPSTAFISATTSGMLSPVLSGYVSPVTLDDVIPLTPDPVSGNESTTGDNAISSSPTHKSEDTSKVPAISPSQPILSTKDAEDEGISKTLVIKIIGAHATAKETTTTIIKSENLSTVPLFQKSANADLLNKATKGSKRKISCSDALDPGEHDHKVPKPETDSESLRSISPVPDDFGMLRHKRRSPSIDALSETSSVDGPFIRTRAGDSAERSDSPALRSIRMSTRNHGRRRNSPSDSSTDSMARDDKTDLTPVGKPIVVTRGSKRRQQPSHDEDTTPDKRIKLDTDHADSVALIRHPESSDEDMILGDLKNKGNSVSTTSFYPKGMAKTTPVKTKANNSHGPVEEKQKKKATGIKANEMIQKEEVTSSKRVARGKIVAESKEDGIHLAKEESKGDAADPKGKRTTRSCKSKIDHCELPAAAHLKRRRSSRDHR